MAAKIVRLDTKTNSQRRARAEDLRQVTLDFVAQGVISRDTADELVAAIDREAIAANGWIFVMISPRQHADVVRWLTAHSARPIVAVELWAELFDHLNRETGEVLQTRADLAAIIGIPVNEVSRLMTELESIGAIIRKRDGRGVKYFMNPNVGTHLPGAARARAQAKAPKLRLVSASG